MVWITFLKMYWKYVLVLVALSLLSISLVWMTISNIKLESTVALQAKDLAYIAKEREQDARDYQTAINEYTENMKHRDTIFKTKTERIYIWEDKNASCEDVINRFNNYTF
jgi:uncharacterized membrane protein